MRLVMISAVVATILSGSLASPIARAQSLDQGVARIAGSIAPQLLQERLRPGVAGAVDLFLVEPVDATTQTACAALSDTLAFRLAAALQTALAQYRRQIASVILRQTAKEGELALRLDWVARSRGKLELRPSYGRMRGDNIVGAFTAPVEIDLQSLSGLERACLPAQDFAAAAETGSDTSVAETPDAGSNLRFFHAETGKTYTIPETGALLSMVGTPCRARSDLVCVRIDGKNRSFSVGRTANVRGDRAKCVLTLLEIVRDRNAARFSLKCEGGVAAPTQADLEAAPERHRFTMTRGTSKIIPPNQTVLSMVGTPCRARADLVCVRIDGKDRSMSHGSQVNLVDGAVRCKLTLITLDRKSRTAEFDLNCN